MKYATTPMRMFDMKNKHVDIITFNNEEMTISKYQDRLTEWLNKT